MTTLITLTLAGSDTGPFDLYSDADGYTTPFETGLSKATLLAGYTSTLVPAGSTEILVKSTGVCLRNLYLPIAGGTTTTTSTTSSTTSSTTTTPPSPYSVVLTSPCSGIYSTFKIDGFTAGDVVVLEADFTGLMNAPTTPGYGTRADIFISDGMTGNNNSSPCYPYPSPSEGFSINAQISVTMGGASKFINTTAVVNNSSSSVASMSLKIVSVNGVPLGISAVGCVGNSSGSTC